ncbi:hypothetical protein D3C85_576750 [compost metagenome]
MDERPVITDPVELQAHRHFDLAVKFLAILEDNFPRRNFQMQIRHRFLQIQVVGAYTRLMIHGERNVKIHCGSCEWPVTISGGKTVMSMRNVFAFETRFRKTQSHQRQQIKLWLAQLAETEMLQTDQLEVKLNEFTDDKSFSPVATWTWKALPDDPVVAIKFLGYKSGWCGDQEFRVSFGYKQRYFAKMADIVSFFNGNDVFKVTDQDVKPEDFAEIPKTMVDDGSAVVLIKRENLARCTPYLLLMDAKHPEITQAIVTPSVFSENKLEQDAMHRMIFKRKIEDFVRVRCHPALQWDFHYANVPQEPDIDSFE